MLYSYCVISEQSVDFNDLTETVLQKVNLTNNFIEKGIWSMLKTITQHFKIIIFGLVGSILGLWLGEGFNTLLNFILGLIGMIFACVFSAGFMEESIKLNSIESDKTETEIKKKRFNETPNRLRAYFICVCILYAVCSFTVGLVSNGQSEGEVEQYEGRMAGIANYVPPESCETKQRWTKDVFFILLIPSLLGVRFTIGERQNKL